MEFQMMTAVMQDPRMQAEWFRESPQIDQRCVWINPRRSREVNRRFGADFNAKASRRFGLEGCRSRFFAAISSSIVFRDAFSASVAKEYSFQCLMAP